MTELEQKLLLNMCGEVKSIDSWGAWITACLEGLVNLGYVTQEGIMFGIAYVPTDLGKAKAKEIADALPK
jgi:hypothetical protein